MLIDLRRSNPMAYDDDEDIDMTIYDGDGNGMM